MRMYPDLLESVQNVRPIAKSSAITYRYLLLRFASHVIATGISASEICCLTDLIQIARVDPQDFRGVQRRSVTQSHRKKAEWRGHPRSERQAMARYRHSRAPHTRHRPAEQ